MKVMKSRKYQLMLAISFISLLLLAACDNRSTSYTVGDDETPPPVPTGVTTTTGDGFVWVNWQMIRGVPDLAGFKIWRSLNDIEFYHIGTVGKTVSQYEDYDVTNGETYYYGVSSYDYDGNESDASFDYEFAYDTPRPEGFDEIIFDFNDPGHVNSSGFDFSREETVPFDLPRCDLFLEYDADLSVPGFFIWLGYNGKYIQDMGYTASFDDITYAPDGGWSQYDYVEAIEGHTYVIETYDGHYAKVRATLLDTYPDYIMIFDWGYQIDPGNRELKIDPRSIRVLSDSNGVAQ